MAASSLNEVGAAEGKPVMVQWRWHYSRPTLLLWIALAVLLFLPKENRKWQAWLILVVPLLALMLRLFYFIPSLAGSNQFDFFVQLLVTLAIGWACVWLAAPYISGGSRVRSCFLAAVVMLGAGFLAHLGYFGFWCGPEAVANIFMWCMGGTAMLIALPLSGICCRRRFHPGIVAAWLLLWLPMAMGTSVVMVYGSYMLAQGEIEWEFLVFLLAPIFFMSTFGAAILYALNAPVLLLAGLTDCYRERFRSMLYRPRPESDSDGGVSVAGDNPFVAQASPAGENPFGEEPAPSDE